MLRWWKHQVCWFISDCYRAKTEVLKLDAWVFCDAIIQKGGWNLRARVETRRRHYYISNRIVLVVHQRRWVKIFLCCIPLTLVLKLCLCNCFLPKISFFAGFIVVRLESAVLTLSPLKMSWRSLLRIVVWRWKGLSEARWLHCFCQDLRTLKRIPILRLAACHRIKASVYIFEAHACGLDTKCELLTQRNELHFPVVSTIPLQRSLLKLMLLHLFSFNITWLVH